MEYKLTVEIVVTSKGSHKEAATHLQSLLKKVLFDAGEVLSVAVEGRALPRDVQ